MRSRMTPEQLAANRAAADNSNTLNKLADKANGDGVTRAKQRAAQAALEKAKGKRGAKQLMEQSMQRHGARAKGLGRWIG